MHPVKRIASSAAMICPAIVSAVKRYAAGGTSESPQPSSSGR